MRLPGQICTSIFGLNNYWLVELNIMSLQLFNTMHFVCLHQATKRQPKCKQKVILFYESMPEWSVYINDVCQHYRC